MSAIEKNTKLFEMQTLAFMMNGRCLSKEYINKNEPLEWQCKKGHRWQASYTVIAQGAWCMQCAKRDYNLKQMMEYAKEFGGTLLSTVFINFNTKYIWQCKNGHRWSQLFPHLKKSGWCRACKAEKINAFFFERIRKKVEQRGGKLLSKKYQGSLGYLQLQCSAQHRWKANAQNILSGYWCKKCAGSERNNISTFQKIATQRGGKCLTKKYVNKHTKLLFQCSHGHQWEAAPGNILKGTWCLICSRKKNKTDTDWHKVMQQASKLFFKKNTMFSIQKLATAGGIDLANHLAKIRGGRCLAKTYTHSRTKMQWQCQIKHTWLAPLEFISQGSWCPFCSGVARYTLDDMRKWALKKNGQCLSTEYLGIENKLRWQCAKGHQWDATPSHIKKGSWCTTCNGGVKLSIEYMQQLAEKRGGKCLSNVYHNKSTKLQWQCAKGHQWFTSYSIVYKGSWCPKCGKEKNVISRNKTRAVLRIASHE
jgi:hypothetical protein